jgi:hypothetical protein
LKKGRPNAIMSSIADLEARQGTNNSSILIKKYSMLYIRLVVIIVSTARITQQCTLPALKPAVDAQTSRGGR